MREIKFRGKSLTPTVDLNYLNIEHDNGWVFGTYIDGYIINDVIEANDEYITIGNWVPVDNVGQYTGLKDKNGVEIFEGDWIRVETQEKDNGEFPIGYVVRANDKPEMFIALPEQLKETGERQYHLENLYKHYSDEFEVIGNIYENSGLMEEQK